MTVTRQRIAYLCGVAAVAVVTVSTVAVLHGGGSVGLRGFGLEFTANSQEAIGAAFQQGFVLGRESRS